MSDKLVRICNRSDTADNWSTNNPILLNGEIGYDSTNNMLKVGNGVDKYSELNSIGNKIFHHNSLYKLSLKEFYVFHDYSSSNISWNSYIIGKELDDDTIRLLQNLKDIGFNLSYGYADICEISSSSVRIDNNNDQFEMIGYSQSFEYSEKDNPQTSIIINNDGTVKFDFFSSYPNDKYNLLNSEYIGTSYTAEELYKKLGGQYELSNNGYMSISGDFSIDNGNTAYVLLYLPNTYKGSVTIDTADNAYIDYITLLNMHKEHKVILKNDYTNATDWDGATNIIDNLKSTSTYKVEIPGYYPVYVKCDNKSVPLYSLTDANSTESGWYVKFDNVTNGIYLEGPIYVSEVFGENGERSIEITEL